MTTDSRLDEVLPTCSGTEGTVCSTSSVAPGLRSPALFSFWFKARLPSDLRRNIGAFVSMDDVKMLDLKWLFALLTDLEVQVWSFDGIYLGCDGAKALARHCEGEIRELVLKGNGIGVEGSKALAMALEHNTTLTALDIEKNDVGNDGAVQFACALQQNRTLNKLSLSSTRIRWEGASAIADALEHNETVNDLCLGNTNDSIHIWWDNNIGDEGADAIASALRLNTSLRRLDISRSHVGSDGHDAIVKALQDNPVLLESIDFIDQNDDEYDDGLDEYNVDDTRFEEWGDPDPRYQFIDKDWHADTYAYC